MKNTSKYILSYEDLKFLSKYTGKSLESIKEIATNLKEENPNATDYDFINRISENKGTEAYHALSNYKIESKEYVTGFAYIKNAKTFDLKTKEGKTQHVYRNKNQFGKAPIDLKSMMKFVEAGYFAYEGFSPCHNILPKENSYESRYNTLSECIYLVKNKLMNKMNKYSSLGNISFRGIQGTSFEGCQFIYNFKTQKLVTDSVNRGTWDFGKSATPGHFFLDILPWLSYGNGNNTETPEMFIMTPTEEAMYLKYANPYKDKINSEYINIKLPNFLKTSLEFAKTYFGKNNKSFETYYVKSAENYIKDLKTSKSLYKDNFIKSYEDCKLGKDKIECCYQNDWERLMSLFVMLDDMTIIDGLNLYVSTLRTDPIILKPLLTDAYKEKFCKDIMTSTINECSTNKENAIKGSSYTIILPIKVTLSLSENIKTKLSHDKETLGKDVFEKQMSFYYNNYIFPRINEKLGKCGCSIATCKVMDNNELVLTISFIHTISEYETVYCSENSLQSYYNSISSESPALAKEDLVPVKYPEYSFSKESVSETIAIVIGAVCAISAVSYTVYRSCKDEILLKKMNNYASIIEKNLEDEYYRCGKIIKSLRQSNLLNELKKWDKFGSYSIVTRNSEYFKQSFDWETKDSFIENILLKIATQVNDSKGSSTMDSSAIKKIDYSYKFITGKPLFDILAERAEQKIITNKKEPIGSGLFGNIEFSGMEKSITTTMEIINNIFDKYSDYDNGVLLTPKYDKAGNLLTVVVDVNIKNCIDPDKLLEFINIVKGLK